MIPSSLADRIRNAKWCAERRKCRAPNAWLAGAPPFDAHLPGISMTMRFDPQPRWPVELRNTRGMHGMLTEILGARHERWPQWTLRPWESGWAVHWIHAAGAALALRTVDAVLYDRPTRVTFGPVVRLRAPSIDRRGHRQVRLDTITPVSRSLDGPKRPEVRPSSESLAHACRDFAARISPSDRWYEWVKARIKVGAVDVHTEPAHVPLGDKYGTVQGWQGHVVADCNAVAHWLLVAGSRIGFGARAAFGFGCIRVTEVP